MRLHAVACDARQAAQRWRIASSAADAAVTQSSAGLSSLQSDSRLESALAAGQCVMLQEDGLTLDACLTKDGSSAPQSKPALVRSKSLLYLTIEHLKMRCVSSCQLIYKSMPCSEHRVSGAVMLSPLLYTPFVWALTRGLCAGRDCIRLPGTKLHCSPAACAHCKQPPDVARGCAPDLAGLRRCLAPTATGAAGPGE